MNRSMQMLIGAAVLVVLVLLVILPLGREEAPTESETAELNEQTQGAAATVDATNADIPVEEELDLGVEGATGGEASIDAMNSAGGGEAPDAAPVTDEAGSIAESADRDAPATTLGEDAISIREDASTAEAAEPVTAEEARRVLFPEGYEADRVALIIEQSDIDPQRKSELLAELEAAAGDEAALADALEALRDALAEVQ